MLTKEEMPECPVATTVQLVGSKWKLLILRNLLGDGDIVYSAYESQRVRRIRSGDTLCYAPHATRLTYAYPRSFYLTVSYRF